VFSNPGGIAFNADRLTVDGRMFLGKAQCTGEVRLFGAHIKSQLLCSEATFNAGGRA
jgi:hypothetical protein